MGVGVVARPSKLTGEARDRIVAAIRAGNYAEPACRSAGISAATYYRWMARGEQEEAGSYAEFREAVLLAEAEAEVHAVAVMRRAMPQDWRAAITYLERRYPARWRRRQLTELTGADGGPIQTSHAALDLSKLSDEELALLEELSERASRTG